MPIDKITANQFATVIADGVNSRDETLDVNIGAIRDLFIDPVSEILEQQNNRIAYLSDLISMKYSYRVSPDDLDDYVYNENLVRWNGVSATTTVFFARAQAPTVDIVIPVNFPLASIPDPTNGVSVLFRTIESKTMYAAAASSYYNADTKLYEIEVAVTSVLTGADVSVGAQTITLMRRPFPAFDRVFNRERAEGSGTETNADLTDRYMLHIEGAQEATPSGLSRWLQDNFSTVDDVYVVYGADQYLTREDDDAGAVDAWIKGSVPLTRTYIVTFVGIEMLIPMDRQPVIEVLSVSDGAITYIEGTDYAFVTGEGEYCYSNYATDGIRFIAGGSAPTIGGAITIQYRYNSLINMVASYFTQPEYYVMGQDRLFRWAQPKYVTLEANLTVNSGSPDAVALAVRNAVKNYINTLELGDDLEEFDVDREVSKVRGVDNWTYTVLAVRDSTGVGDITIAPYEYAQIEDADFIINLV